MRRGIIGEVLNVVITLLAVGVVFSGAFYVYNSFLANTQKSDAVRGFENFINPISEACNNPGQRALAFDVRLPTLDFNYVYGIFQTKLGSGETYFNDESYKYPQAMLEKCTDQYCLCLFQMRRKLWSSWAYTAPPDTSDIWAQVTTTGDWVFKPSDAAPLWHFNTPGITALTKLMPVILIRFFMNIIQVITLTYIVPSLTGVAAACSPEKGPWALITCPLAFGALYAISGFVWVFIEELIHRTFEPLLFYNYPQHLMTQGSKDMLEWKAGDGTYDCYAVMKPDDWAVFGDILGDSFFSALEYGYEQFIKGLIKGLTKGLSSVAGKLDEAPSGLLAFHKMSQLGAVMGSKWFKVIKYALVAGLWTSKLTFFPLRRSLSKFILKTPQPVDLSPSCNTAEILAKRQATDLDCFAGNPFLGKCWDKGWGRQLAPEQTYDMKVYDLFPSDLSVMTCVSIDELGPNCGNDPVKLVADTDYFLLFRLTDPVNYPMDAIYCGYQESEQTYEMNIFEMILGARSLWGGFAWVYDILKVFLDIIIGDILLAGIHSSKGMFIDCVVPQYAMQGEAEYFQYWIPYPDLSNIWGYDGNIFMLEAEVNIKGGASDISACNHDALLGMTECSCRHKKWEDCSELVLEYYSDESILNGIIESTDFLDLVFEDEMVSVSECMQITQCAEELSECKNPVCSGTSISNLLTSLTSWNSEILAILSGVDEIEFEYDKLASIYETLKQGSVSEATLDALYSLLYKTAVNTDFRESANNDFTEAADSYASCFEIYESEYNRCEPGIYIETVGVLK